MILQPGVTADPDQVILVGPEWVYVGGLEFKTISQAYDWWASTHGDDMTPLYDLLDETHGRTQA